MCGRYSLHAHPDVIALQFGLAVGYYEWKVEAGRKQPYFLRRDSGEPFAMAGLWEQWRSSDGQLTETLRS
jgi:putative SOS response-associated peptidase YedK